MDNDLKEKEVVIDIESGEASQGGNAKSNSKLGKISLKRLVSGVLSYNGSVNVETTDKNLGGESSQELVPLVGNEHEKERQRGGKVKKAWKPPRPPKGPSLDAVDMRMLKEISRTAIKKRERKERVKALKKMKSAKLLSASSSPLMTSSSLFSSSVATISAMFVSVFFFIVLFFQGPSSSTSSSLTIVEAPRPAPETMGFTPMEYYKTVMTDDGAAPSFLPPKSMK